jgi:DNA polymerase-3 subunit epsilon/CBS domain-containing protein
MVLARNAVPLAALDAVVIDTETTGPDARKASIVEIAGIRLARGRLDDDTTFRRLVNPKEPIPPASTGVHQISDADVAGAPDFAGVWPDYSAFAGDRVVIGHMIGFDLAVIKRECERAGIDFTPPPSLCTRLLAQAIEPTLSVYSLESLAEMFGVEISGRHSALGDAATTARIFCALVPRLRARGIRTLGEALQVCRQMHGTLADQHQAGWLEAAGPQDRASAAVLGRIDTYPYRHRARDAMSAPARSIAASAPLREAIARLAAEKISSLFVHDGHNGAQDLIARDVGIVTERDTLRALAMHGAGALDLPVGRFAARPLVTVGDNDFVYRAIARMSGMKIRHLAVVDAQGRVAGALSARDLLRLRAQDAVTLGDEIERATTRNDLAAAWPKLPQVAAALRAEDVPGCDVAAVISEELCTLTRQAAILAERQMHDEGKGTPPCPYALAVLGSAGRGESLLALDQDNALVFAEGEPDGAQDRWFESFATIVNAILDEAGVPLCKGGVMAKNAVWRGSLATWRARVAEWIGRSRPEDLLSVDIFFDLRGVHGDLELADTLWRAAFDAAEGQTGFLKLVAESAGGTEPGFGFLGRFRTVEGRIDLKRAGTFGIVTTARILAIRHHIVERSTLARLAGLQALKIGAENDLDALARAERVFLDLIADQQVEDIAAGRPPSNKVEVKRLGGEDRDRLRDALEAVRNLDELTRNLLFRN